MKWAAYSRLPKVGMWAWEGFLLVFLVLYALGLEESHIPTFWLPMYWLLLQAFPMTQEDKPQHFRSHNIRKSKRNYILLQPSYFYYICYTNCLLNSAGRSCCSVLNVASAYMSHVNSYPKAPNGPQSYIIWSLGPKALKYESLEP